MDKHTLMLELKGLSRVVDGDVRGLIFKRSAIKELSDAYEPVNPFETLLDVVEDELGLAIQHNIFAKLSDGERTAFRNQWEQMRAHEQLRCLEQYCNGAGR